MSGCRLTSAQLEITMWNILIPAITGLISGVIGSLVAPWAQWGIEKKRRRFDARFALVAEVRELLSDPPTNQEFRILPLYSKLRPHLSPKARKAVEGEYDGRSQGETILIIEGNGRHSGVNPYAQQVLDELAKLESKWGLL